MGTFQDFLLMYPGGLDGYLATADQLNKEDKMDLPRGCTEVDMTKLPGVPAESVVPLDPNAGAPRPRSQFGNPVWGHDDNEATQEMREGRRQGFDEALRLILGPSIMSNNREFDTGVDSVLDLLRRRRAEL